MNDKTNEYFDLVALIIKKYLPNAKILLYGSRARKTHAQGADIDIAIDNKSSINREIIIAILDEIEESSLPIKYDIVDYHKVSDQMQKEIMKDGIPWKRSN